MNKTHALNVLFTEHPQWSKISRNQFTVMERGNWTYIAYKGVEIERVAVNGGFIFEEWLGHSQDPDDYR